VQRIIISVRKVNHKTASYNRLKRLFKTKFSSETSPEKGSSNIRLIG